MVFIMTYRALLAAGVAACLTLTACSAPAEPADTATPHVIAAFYPLEWATSEVLGEHGSVSTLTSPGTEAHDLELSPRQIASLAEADLVVYLEGFQPAVDKAIEQAGVTNAFDVSSVVDLLPAEEADHDHAHEDADEHDDDHDHHDGEHADDEHDGHDHGDFDPHFWQDPQRMEALVKALGERIAQVDPANAADYQAQTADTATGLATLDEEFAAGLGSCERSEFITTHAAFGYLAARYGLTELGISGVNPDDEPSPARIAEIHREAETHSITTIFFETLTSDAVAKSIAGDLGLETAVLDPLEGLTPNSPGEDYPSIMRANLEALRSANGCR